MKKVIKVNVERCLGCRSCQLACSVSHSRTKQLITAIKETPVPRTRVSLVNEEGLVIPLQCRHCEDAPCIKVCPTAAAAREGEDGPVIIDHDKCIGCQWCVLMCPFGVISFDSKSKAIVKCDLCRERLAAGEDPACVSACPTHALEFVEPEEIPVEKQRKSSRKTKITEEKDNGSQKK